MPDHSNWKHIGTLGGYHHANKNCILRLKLVCDHSARLSPDLVGVQVIARSARDESRLAKFCTELSHINNHTTCE